MKPGALLLAGKMHFILLKLLSCDSNYYVKHVETIFLLDFVKLEHCTVCACDTAELVPFILRCENTKETFQASVYFIYCVVG